MLLKHMHYQQFVPLGHRLLVINAESAKKPLEISQLPSGIYLLHIRDHVGNYRTLKFVRQ